MEERRQVKWPVWGTIVAIGGKLLLSAVGFAVGMVASTGHLARLSIPTSLMLLPDLSSKFLYILIPLSFALLTLAVVHIFTALRY